GRLRNIGKLKNWLMAVAEAVTNSLDSLSSSQRGKIVISIERENSLLEGEEQKRITAIKVVDTGVGFTDQNFQSFCTPDSQHKRHIGGKGLGRLMCLQAFESVEVESYYFEEGEWLFRRAILKCDAPCLQDSLADGQVDKLET